MPVSPHTCAASLSPARSGVVLYNLPARRIVQIENTYESLPPSGEVNCHNGKLLSFRLVPYKLSPDWTTVP